MGFNLGTQSVSHPKHRFKHSRKKADRYSSRETKREKIDQRDTKLDKTPNAFLHTVATQTGTTNENNLPTCLPFYWTFLYL